MLKTLTKQWLACTLLALLLPGCAAVMDNVVDEQYGERHETTELSLIYYDESRGASASTQWEIDELLDESAQEDAQQAEATQPFEEVDFKLKVIDASREKITLTVQLEDQPEQKVVLHVGERREFRPKNRDRKIGLSFREVNYYF